MTEGHKFDLTGLSVMMSIPVNRDFPPDVTQSLIETMDMFSAVFGRDRREMVFQRGGTIPEARSRTVHDFVRWAKDDKAKLFWIDSDIVWKAEDAMRLLALSTVYDLVFAAYPLKRDPPIFCLKHETVELNEHGLISDPDLGIGLGFGVASVRAMRAMWNRGKWLTFPGGERLPIIFRYDDDGSGQFRGEDMAFFHDLHAAGFPLHIDPTITLGHVGPKVYRANILDYMQQVSPAASEVA